MRNANRALGVHETRDILQKQIEGRLPIRPAYKHASGMSQSRESAIPAPKRDQLSPSSTGPLIRPDDLKPSK